MTVIILLRTRMETMTATVHYGEKVDLKSEGVVTYLIQFVFQNVF